tara:strand:- start:40 stop:549 length:510 start_codon:yes stop_codon:yes gene_type:complete
MSNHRVLSVKVEALDPNDEGFIVVQVRENRLPLDDNGIPNGPSFYHRTVHMPDHDASAYSPTVAAICASIHTQEWKDKYQAKLDAEAAVIEAERLEQERVAAEAEAVKLAEQEAAAIVAEQEAADQKVIDDAAAVEAAVQVELDAIAAQEEFEAKVAAAVAAALETTTL